MSVQRANTLTTAWASVSPARVFSAAVVYPLLARLAAVADGPARAELLAVAPTPLDLPVRGALGIWAREGAALTLDWAARSDPRLTGDPAVDRPLLDAWAAAQTGAPVPPLPPVSGTDEHALVLASALAVTADWREPFTDGVMRPPSGPWAGRRLASLHRRGPDLSALRVAATAAGPVTLLTVAGAGEVDVVLCTAGGAAPPGAVLGAAVAALATGDDPAPGGSAAPAAGDGPGSGSGGSAAPAAGDGPGAGGSAALVGGAGITVAMVAADDPEPELVVKVPRFAAAEAHDLLALSPEVFGLSAAAVTGAFPGIGTGPLRVRAAGQSVAAAFTAPGFRAAPVAPGPMIPMTYAPHGTRRLRVTARFDLPFGYLAVHRPTGLVLMAGWIDDPEEAR
jgi:hypothetical protein